MLAGELYDPADPELSAERQACRRLCRRLNLGDPGAGREREEILGELFGSSGEVWVEPPFHCDYGWNIHLGQKVFFNFGCVVLDVAPVHVGDHVLIGPSVQIYTATHPLDAKERRGGLESAKPVRIGSDVWIGGGAILCPGVSIGDRAVVGAGSVVTRDVPGDVVVAGNPARILRHLGA